MTTMIPSDCLHKRNYIRPRYSEIWAYKPSSIYFSTNRNTPVSVSVRMVTNNFHPSFRIKVFTYQCLIFDNFFNRILHLLPWATQSLDLSYTIRFQIITANWLSLVFPYCLDPIDYQSTGIRVKHCSATLYYVNDKIAAFNYVCSQYIRLSLRIFLVS